MNIDEIMNELTLEEKCSLLSGADFWNLKSIERLGIRKIMMTDGPHGLRKQDMDASEIGLEKSVPATCFPSGAALASTWNKNLIKEVGKAIAKECLDNDVDVLLGPAVNIKRSPLCGRNFEYYSEDPVLSSKIAKYFIKGVQSQGVSACIKHFAANNQEFRRLTTDVRVDERAFREIYLKSFEEAIKEAKPDCVMCAYNKINGEYASDNKKLLNDILREEWGYEGVVISDWGAVNDRVKSLEAGMDIEMPSCFGVNDRIVYEAVKSGKIKIEVLDRAVKRILKLILKHSNKSQTRCVDYEYNHRLASKVAEEAVILLKNDDDILPLNKDSRIAIIGEFAKNPRFQGGGSSHVNPTKLECPIDEIKKYANSVVYARGFNSNNDEIDEALIKEAVNLAKISDVVVLFLGLPERYESEGFDRADIKLPYNQNILVDEIYKVNKNIVVSLSVGSCVEMPWLDKVKAVLNGYLLGQAGGSAIANILFGYSVPSGKLSETFIKRLEDNPSYINFPGSNDRVYYGESVFVGYRYYDYKNIDVQFPFGHGLSYTRFEYSNLKIDKNDYFDDECIDISFKLKNVGKYKAKEVVQVYISKPNSSIIRPIKELKEFEKIELDVGEEREVNLKIKVDDLSYFDEQFNSFLVEEGEYKILIGSSSRDIRLEGSIKVKNRQKVKRMYHINSTIMDVIKTEKGKELLKELVQMLDVDENNVQAKMMKEFYLNMPLRGLIYYGNGKYDFEKLNEIIDLLNNEA
ncbi:beta-glucosidase [Thermobrachium celere]|uniref:Beta-glucosidase n=1 Tax=Thermobrachium celere DSM 8682 TaxID=941824 RepID=R7RMQ6_9CLOT|nr:glycoside hydrolase family 3 C-terminal domain-containing protein [Thermobrachium celere]CDF57462.1 Beta-glucosidase [Thermobrachium celere DSM 8682]